MYSGPFSCVHGPVLAQQFFPGHPTAVAIPTGAGGEHQCWGRASPRASAGHGPLHSLGSLPAPASLAPSARLRMCLVWITSSACSLNELFGPENYISAPAPVPSSTMQPALCFWTTSLEFVGSYFRRNSR